MDSLVQHIQREKEPILHAARHAKYPGIKRERGYFVFDWTQAKPSRGQPRTPVVQPLSWNTDPPHFPVSCLVKDGGLGVSGLR